MMNDAEFLSAWEALSSFGAVKGTLGVDREAATEADGQQRKWFESLLAEHGFKVVRDEIGNQFALYEFHEGAPYVLTGSHLDSQPTAGRFDGAYGVLASAAAAIRCVEHLQSSPEKARYNLAVVNWFNEEGSRFKPSLMGSSVYTGKLELSEALATTDVTGVTVQQALDAIDERGSFDGLEVVGYAEIHVQQGRSMEEQGVKIGLVHATWGAHKFEMKFGL